MRVKHIAEILATDKETVTREVGLEDWFKFEKGEYGYRGRAGMRMQPPGSMTAAMCEGMGVRVSQINLVEQERETEKQILEHKKNFLEETQDDGW